MKLYYAPGACSLSPHIVLREAGLEFEIERVDLASKTTESGADFTAINPKSYVPALEFGDGDLLTEGVAIVQYLADSNGLDRLAPKAGSRERAHLVEWLNFISTELHKSFSPLFNSGSPEVMKTAAREKVRSRFDMLEDTLSDDREFLIGDGFSVADAYLFTVTNWAHPTGIGLDAWPNLARYMARLSERPSVRDAMLAEGLLEAA